MLYFPNWSRWNGAGWSVPWSWCHNVAEHSGVVFVGDAEEAEEISTADLKHAVAEIKQKCKLFWYCRDIAVTYKVCAYLYLFFK